VPELRAGIPALDHTVRLRAGLLNVYFLDAQWDCLGGSIHIDDPSFAIPIARHLLMADDNSSNWIGNIPKGLLDNTPEDLQDNPLILYFRCEYNSRDEVKQLFSPAERKKIDLELERIEKLRSAFTQIVENNLLVQSMSRSRMAWRRHAKELCSSEAEKKKVNARLKEAPAASKPRHRGHLGLLQRVSSWRISADPLRPNTSLEEDRGYGFVVYKITLKRNDKPQGSRTSSFNKYSLDTHPVHDILYKKEDNPLAEKCKKDTIRYFHFPANNMLWVEVRIVITMSYLY
jgi:hypothetical protein